MIMIILVHYGQNFLTDTARLLDFLQMGCPIFFVASGFGITCLINNKYDGRLNVENTRSFYLSRYKALAPGWYTAIAIVFIVNSLMLCFNGTMLQFGADRRPLSIICNLLFIHGVLPFCFNSVMVGGWYIGTTAILYAITPVVHMMISKARNRRVFFVISSSVFMLIWIILFFSFRGPFMDSGFGYCIFPVHYPEYLLGMMLYCDLNEGLLNTFQIKRCLPLSIIAMIVAVVLFNVPMRVSYVPSAWMTALSTYLALYYMISNECESETRGVIRVFEKFGKNSYCIFLVHIFIARTLDKALLDILYCELNIPIVVCYLSLIPSTLILSYYTGLTFSKVLGMIKVIFRLAEKHNNIQKI